MKREVMGQGWTVEDWKNYWRSIQHSRRRKEGEDNFNEPWRVEYVEEVKRNNGN